MSDYTVSAIFDNDHGSLSGLPLDISSIHFSNQILLQIRLNGEMDSTYEVTRRGLNTLDQGVSRPIAGFATLLPEEQDDDDDDYSYNADVMRDNLADFQVLTKLGDSTDHKMPVICTQIGELYQSVIMPMLRKNGKNNELACDGSSLLITMSTKIFRQTIKLDQDSGNDLDFAKLVFILKTIKEMYIS
ncbi:similar to Saccharomyces cerevisiae YLR021W IRC25 Component of a heterodimeric Poc4p-Irc25p chaperone involved in assembly of alpha subunits into the 20S proteasome [Maudiozyma barnettii]|uniref:Similar to Saccharomyces cerevisiae YLR021W IRC25 Component of a heterodimeric Poc4p-Irc25p chaperone involved in assembly of alpha subunits into the 20S proteasome n=1 Tax=Maudiozyma barnettii TaxID=61262 RepID=A0A8H2VC22_9SACH|nr:Irc25p [Kazachstania barnettii]CAB4252523.1 similar to Saccharomyces cerevisiae YLR021W IRC25 Component of a heterodimeric Poc4p-Irc25p chaperone involved in assembly of alpha subunits into the 20S proteasome [Kazachstania barnettii]CAD1779257.1 similar to Saccharomyces cerevisiae YLR021W IRC25 Component of a heterodimeric Poc4p-Irc25p chaperone involved in assembly of alpha subunits into the 20S proteasome [Kazachstania barnettii]